MLTNLTKLTAAVSFLTAFFFTIFPNVSQGHYPESDPGADHKHHLSFKTLKTEYSKTPFDLSVTPITVYGTENRINIAIIGDGYTSSELINLYKPTVVSTLDYFFKNTRKSIPYPRYEKFFNIYRIDIASNDSGVDDLANGIYRDTALGGENGCTDWTIGICGANWSLVHSAYDQAEQMANFVTDWRLVMLNDDAYNAAAHYPAEGTLPIYSANYSGTWDMRDIALHEGAHAWHYLADEYGGDPTTYPYSEPNEVNVTTDPNGTKWSNWLGYTMPDGALVGAYEGGRYYDKGIYRPTISSKMNGGPGNCHYIGNDCGHNAVGIEKIILDIYDLIDPIDSYTDNSGQLVDAEMLQLKVIDSEVIKVTWSINGQVIAENTTENFDLASYIGSAGTYEISVVARDEVIDHAFSPNEAPHPLDLVRKDFDKLQQTVRWTVVLNDDDDDAIINIQDNCKTVANTDQLNTDNDDQGDACDSDDDNDGYQDNMDAFPLDASEHVDSDGDGVGDNSDAFPQDGSETVDTDNDGVGNNTDTDDDNDGYSDEQELLDGTDPLDPFSCRSGCFNFDLDNNRQSDALTDGLLFIRHLFGISGEALISEVIGSDAKRTSADNISNYLISASADLDIDDNGEADALTDGLLLLRYLFELRGNSLIDGVVAPDAARRSASEIEVYLDSRMPDSSSD